MRASRFLVLIGLVALGCRDEPKPSASGERVDFTTDVVPQVCRGTVESIDAELERIETELKLGATSERVEVHVVDSEHIDEYCGGPWVCVVQPPRRLYMTPEVYEENIRYELVRDRMSRTSLGGSKPVLFEGLAGALTLPSCEPWDLEWEPPSTTAVLEASSRSSLGSRGRYLGGELVRWLLDTQGPEQVFALMGEVDRNDSADEVRVAYLQRFGGSIDSDLFAHLRPDDAPVNPGRAGCLVGVAPPPGDVASRFRLQSDFNCDSPRVRNDFDDPSRVFVEWVLDVPNTRYGVWSLLDDLPEAATLTVGPCRCTAEPWSFLVSYTEEPWPEHDSRWLDPGRYRLRVYAPIGTTIDIELQAPCDVVAQDCPTGQQCTQFGNCLDEIEDPAQLGEPCQVPPEGDAPRTCTAGLSCVGPSGGEGVCLQQCGGRLDDSSCLGDLICAEWLEPFCASTCDPLAQDCASGHGCVPFSPESGSCLPVGDAALFEPCRVFDLDCGPGLLCVSEESVPGCWEFVEGVGPMGCCSPICDPDAPDAGCPPELPVCVPYDDGPFGRCGVPDP